MAIWADTFFFPSVGTMWHLAMDMELSRVRLNLGAQDVAFPALEELCERLFPRRRHRDVIPSCFWRGSVLVLALTVLRSGPARLVVAKRHGPDPAAVGPLVEVPLAVHPPSSHVPLPDKRLPVMNPKSPITFRTEILEWAVQDSNL